MEISDEQLSKLNLLVVERIMSNEIENESLIKSFISLKNNTLQKIIRSGYACKKDKEGTIAYYVVKAPTGELLMYFSLKCGELFEELDRKKIQLASDLFSAYNVLSNSGFNDEERREAEQFIKDKADEINAILPNIKEYLDKKGSYKADVFKELNTQMRRVLKTHPAVEIVEFCANDSTRKVWEQLGLGRKLGECVFWHHIVPKLKEIQNIAGCQYVYLFAADRSTDGVLINYYKEALKFDTSVKLGASKPKYDFSCIFLCQELKSLFERQSDFYANFNPDATDGSIV